MYLIKLYKTKEDKEADNGRTFAVENDIEPRQLAGQNGFESFTIIKRGGSCLELDLTVSTGERSEVGEISQEITLPNRMLDARLYRC